jgi:hypothetical protein
VSGVTGEEAVRAQERATALLQEVTALAADVASLVSGSKEGDALVLDAAVINLR